MCPKIQHYRIMITLLCFLSVTIWFISYIAFVKGFHTDYSVSTRLIFGILSLPELYHDYWKICHFSSNSEPIFLVFNSSLSLIVTGTFFIGAILKKRRSSKQRILSEREYGRNISVFGIIFLTGISAFLPLWLYIIARKEDAVQGREELERLVFEQPFSFWFFQALLLIIWCLFIRRFCIPELTVKTHRRVADPGLN